ncbi:MAG: TetR/AcrR family transcriptional regulator [Candidatus Dormibacteraeota bacterium]|uniref:TetR/AcrR family transcriptional regulator n=1 Tax=Candidatus Dormiibacter inghamiae TaxID=3127013 RepID=A0A934KKC1_9BACT|nr:TetR/AcrR family transcriptional regulator [Candidatus Dormibacteraeota bacterium]MBJ7604805.1 TetR/AcrR family transcriptional regulator [Candidatus Dormibacteraeota bacterium]
MAGQVKTRRYHSEVRSERALATRRRIREAAAELFVDRGYATTTVADIAAKAGVVSKTIYLAFPTKLALFNEVMGVALGGDDEQVKVRDRDWFRQTQEAVPAEMPRLFARFTAALHSRSAALLEAADASAGADPELAVRRERGRENRRADMRRIAEPFAAKSGRDVGYTTDMLYTLGSASVYALLVFQSGWTSEEYEAWLARALTDALVNGPDKNP